ncbi:MAG: 7-cyano-7-deazaguanine synthase QueC [Alphaproteobacteria bacterium]|nr:7-cyano-7-deazaguanine synthase QueC [Alphaproteobacteria bacterium]
MTKLAVTLLSGGLDSVTATAWAKAEGWDVSALSIDYGQLHRRELVAARATAKHLGIPYHETDARFFASLARHSALTDATVHALPQGRAPESMPEGDIPITYVPMRNSVFLTLAAAFLESLVLGAVENRGIDPSTIRAGVIIAANALDYSGYPDCRPSFYAAARSMLNLGSKMFTQHKVEIEILTPLIAMSKAEIVTLGMKLKAPLHLSWSCYLGEESPCGTCDSCLLRAKGFAEAGVKDPAL